MAEVTVRVMLMQRLVDALELGLTSGDNLARQLQGALGDVNLDSSSLAPWLDEGDAYATLSAIAEDARRCLGLASMAQAIDPSPRDEYCFQHGLADALPPDFVFRQAQPWVEAMLAEKFTGAGSALTDGQISAHANQVALIVANAPEPYRELFTQVLPGLDIVHIEPGDPAWTSPVKGTVRVDLAAMATEAPCHYYTLFHKIAHVIDGAGRGIAWTSGNYVFSGPDGLTMALGDWLSQDLRAALIEGGSHLGLAPDQVARVVKAVMGLSVHELSGWHMDLAADSNGGPVEAVPGSDADALLIIKRYFYQHTRYPVDRTVSDVCGGLTLNEIVGAWRHAVGYWAVPQLVGPPASEFWAGWFADSMTHPYQLALLANPQPAPVGVWSEEAPICRPVCLATSRDSTVAAFPTGALAAHDMAENMLAVPGRIGSDHS